MQILINLSSEAQNKTWAFTVLKSWGLRSVKKASKRLPPPSETLEPQTPPPRPKPQILNSSNSKCFQNKETLLFTKDPSYIKSLNKSPGNLDYPPKPPKPETLKP